ncbi:MAG TPA: PQQ-dependent dehydrogenase, methanol/ethanol family [Burkholderiaceae bacterium]|nr:PQQ-dependent dehydrogenase, methanol/ethanol family [Burkholderiaceae bacterium]
MTKTAKTRAPRSWARAAAFIGMALATGFAAAARGPADVDDARIADNARTGTQWPSNGLDYAGTRFSRLARINGGNVGKLGLAWSYDLGSSRGVEATPIVVGGVMYVTGPWAVVHAIDARSGKALWTFDPKTPRTVGWKACCDVVNRGVAVYKGKVYVGTLDAHLIALDAATGARLWEVDTRSDAARDVTITSAPYVVHDKVIIGNGGGEYGTRGYVTAYDAQSGAQAWRWFVTPGDPSKPFEDESQAVAAQTWDPASKYWANGGGGNVWNTMAIDPELNLVYFGTGQPGPWSRSKRGTFGDALYTSSIVALHVDTGKYAWHYQESPSDASDLDSTMDLILADVKLDGQKRKVILHAPKNGFFYVLDRRTGQFISARNYTEQTWAAAIDPNGRPILSRDGVSPDKPFDAIPGPFGGHNWQAMSYSPSTGLAYIPTQHVPLELVADENWGGQDTYRNGGPMQPNGGNGWNTAMQVNPVPPKSKAHGELVAWDPVRQKESWKVDLGAPWNGGTLVTAGGLVFQGTADGYLKAYDATSGRKLWDVAVGGGVIAPPVTYELDGKQYVSVAVGWGGVYGLSTRHTEYRDPGRVFTFVVGGHATMPEFKPYALEPLLSGVKYDPKDVPDGTALYVSNCVFCHGVPGVDKGGAIVNLGYVKREAIEHLDQSIFNGPMVDRGMPDFTGKFTPEQVEKLKAFIQGVPDSIRPK